MKETNERHIALYRKYRPTKFKDVVGQDHIVKVLEGAISLGNISHAYLFAGSRGTGKTSIARIMARELEIADIDTYEIDAASNRGIDDIRSIRESVHTLPFESKYKIYIVDEAHMLTKDAWNAFLKTLEEPPAHVIFILATTELDKVPETVLSRCQVFQFKKPSRKDLQTLALSIAKKEGFSLEPKASELIALLGDGSFRDMNGMLEKVLSFTKDKTISLAEAELVTGAPRAVVVKDFLETIAIKDLNGSLRILQEVSQSGADIKIFLKLALEKLRYALLIKISKDAKGLLKETLSEDEILDLEKLHEKGSGITSITLSKLLSAYEFMGKTFEPTLPIELALIDSLSSNLK